MRRALINIIMISIQEPSKEKEIYSIHPKELKSRVVMEKGGDFEIEGLLQGKKIDHKVHCRIFNRGRRITLEADRAVIKMKHSVTYQTSRNVQVRFGFPSQKQLKPFFMEVYRNVVRKKDSSASLLKGEVRSSLEDDKNWLSSNESKLLRAYHNHSSSDMSLYFVVCEQL